MSVLAVLPAGRISIPIERMAVLFRPAHVSGLEQTQQIAADNFASRGSQGYDRKKSRHRSGRRQ